MIARGPSAGLTIVKVIAIDGRKAHFADDPAALHRAAFSRHGNARRKGGGGGGGNLRFSSAGL